MNNTTYGSQPIKNEQSGTKESWAVIISKIIESIEVPNVNKDPEGSIKGMKTLNGINDLIKIIINLESNRPPLSDEDIERAAKAFSFLRDERDGFIAGANFTKQPHSNEWVKVEDGLPKLYEGVMIAKKNQTVSAGTLHDKYWYDRISDRVCTEDNPVTHWMPLPHPPKK